MKKFYKILQNLDLGKLNKYRSSGYKDIEQPRNRLNINWSSERRQWRQRRKWHQQRADGKIVKFPPFWKRRRQKKRWYYDIRKKFFKWSLRRLNKRKNWLFKIVKWRWLNSVPHVCRFLKKYNVSKRAVLTRKHLVVYGRFPNRWNEWLLRSAGLLYSKRKDLFFSEGIRRREIWWKRYRHRSGKFKFRLYKPRRIKFKRKKAWKWSRLYNRFFKKVYGRLRLRKIYLTKMIFKKHSQKAKYKRLIGLIHNPISLLLPVRLIPYWKRAQRLLWNKQIYVNNKPASWKTAVKKFYIISLGTRTVYFRHKAAYAKRKRRKKKWSVLFLNNMLRDRKFNLFIKYNSDIGPIERHDLQFSYYYSHLLFLQ